VLLTVQKGNSAFEPAIRQLDLDDQQVVEEILSVQKLAYRREASIIDYDRIPALEDTIQSIRCSAETFYGIYIDRRLSGVVSVTQQNSILTICRLVVDPSVHRRGLASRLLAHLDIRYPDASAFRASTAVKNTPALLFYKMHRFEEAKRWKTGDGLELVELERRKADGLKP
jgi:ribosomal protein S18 acetylase RimI-like enzyme